MADLNDVLQKYEEMYAKGDDLTDINKELDDAFRKCAREMYHKGGEIEIDDNAVVSLSDDFGTGINGAYVQAWVYVPRN